MVLVKELIGALRKEDVSSEIPDENRTIKQAMRIRRAPGPDPAPPPLRPRSPAWAMSSELPTPRRRLT